MNISLSKLFLLCLFTIFSLLFSIVCPKSKEECPPNLLQINFKMRFKCGRFRGAEGRLFIRLRKAEWSIGESPYENILETVLDETQNGIFNRTILLPLIITRVNSFEVYFRTNCYILNRFGECCAHDFKFYILVKRFIPQTIVERHWFRSSLDLKNSSLRKCANWRTGKVYGHNCMFTFDTYDELNVDEPQAIDLRQLLLNAEIYKEKRANWTTNDWSEESKMAYTTKRRCSPADDIVEVGIFKQNFYADWTICDHPRYGLNISSFDRPEEKKYKGCLNENGIPENCYCNINSDKPIND